MRWHHHQTCRQRICHSDHGQRCLHCWSGQTVEQHRTLKQTQSRPYVPSSMQKRLHPPFAQWWIMDTSQKKLGNIWHQPTPEQSDSTTYQRSTNLATLTDQSSPLVEPLQNAFLNLLITICRWHLCALEQWGRTTTEVPKEIHRLHPTIKFTAEWSRKGLFPWHHSHPRRN